MEINHLPVEMLMKIFSYLPTYGEVSLVNKLFYSIVCKLDSNIYLRIDKEFYKRFFGNDGVNCQLLQNMKTSTRQVSTMAIVGLFDREKCNLSGIDRVTISVVENFSTTIKCLKLVNVSIDKCTLLEILSLVPNIEQLELDHVVRKITDQSSKRRRCNEDLNLPKLEKLSLIQYESVSASVNIFDRLPVGVLKKLHITGYRNNESVAMMFNRQRNIKDLKLTYGLNEDVTANIFLHLKLESLELCAYRENFVAIAAILTKQTELKSLILSSFTKFYDQKVNDRIMDIISDYLKLEVLKIDISRISLSSFVKIRKLEELKDLTLKCDADEGSAKLRALAESDNISIKRLSLTWKSKMPVNLIGVLAKSVPHLTHLTILPKTSTEVDAIMSHFNFVEVLEITAFSNPSDVTSDRFNPKLKELQITNGHPLNEINIEYFHRILPRLIAAYPNLEKLILKIQPYTKTHLEIREIINGFKKLESLIVKSHYGLTVPDLDCLNDNTRNLKFVSLERLRDERDLSTDDVVKKLRSNFDVVKIDQVYYNLEVSPHRYTMHRERCELCELINF